MGGGISRAQVNEYREVVKDRMSEEAIAFLHLRFTSAAPDGVMTPLLFKKYIDSTGVYKNRTIVQRQRQAAMRQQRRSSAVLSPSSWFSGGRGSKATERAIEVEDGSADDIDDGELYSHLFRGYDLDGDGVISFKEFLIYHLAIVYSTEELCLVIFSTYDEDQDGYLSLGDLKAVITASTRYVGDYDVRDREVRRVIDEEARRLMAFLDIRRQGRVQRDDMRLIAQKYPQILEKMKNLM